jgi:hypothetical protein
MTQNDEVPDWVAVTRRNARSVQTTIGWVYFDPGAEKRLETLGLPGKLGYIAGRAAPLGPAGPEAVVAAFGSISPLGVAIALDLVAKHTTFDAVWAARDAAVLDGLTDYAPDIKPLLVSYGPALWEVVDQLPRLGRVFFAAHLRMARPVDPVLSGWHAINCLREWRGDTHWAVIAAAGLDGPEASILHNAWVGYEKDWMPSSRGSTPEETEAAWSRLEQKGLAIDGKVTRGAVELRQRIEDDTDELTALPWQLAGKELALRFADEFEPPCEKLLARVDVTAGSNYQPASRIH